MNELFVALNTMVVGKVPPSDPRWWDYNCAFRTRRVSVRDLQHHICQGFSYTAPHRGLCHWDKLRRRWTTYRVQQNWLAGQHIGVDCDGSTIWDVLEYEFVQRYAAFVHTTASHEQQAPRCRILLIVDEPVLNLELYRRIIAGVLHELVDVADSAARDPLRIFYGAPACTLLDLGNCLNMRAAETLAESVPEQPSRIAVASRNSSIGGTPWAIVQSALEAIPHHPRMVGGRLEYPLDYQQWRDIIWAVGSEFNNQEVIGYLYKWSPCRRPGEIEQLMAAAKGHIGLGTLFHIAAQHGWQRPDLVTLLDFKYGTGEL